MKINESVVRVMESKDAFGEAFYEVFLGRYPEAQSYFSGVDMKRQALLLTMAVSLIEQYYSCGYPAMEKYLNHLGSQHHRHAIPRELYPKWRDAMIETLRQFLGVEWSDELATEWTDAIDLSASAMFAGYSQRFTV